MISRNFLQMFDDLTRGMIAQPLGDFDTSFTHEMTEWMFAAPDENFGDDINSRNIQRGRDHQIQGYTFYKRLCGLGNTQDW